MLLLTIYMINEYSSHKNFYVQVNINFLHVLGIYWLSGGPYIMDPIKSSNIDIVIKNKILVML